MAAPNLTGFAPGPVAENVVNVTPQLLDGDVTFTDPDNNFDTGTLTITGLLAEETIAIRNVGAGAGEIGFSGGNVSYQGILIGTATGGAGTTLTVTFNASATAAAIDALIQNLTYANSSDTTSASGRARSDSDGRGRRGHARAAALRRADRRCQSLQRHERLCLHANVRRPRRRRRSRRGGRGKRWNATLFPQHRDRVRAGLRRADRRRQSLQRHRCGVVLLPHARRPRRRWRSRRGRRGTAMERCAISAIPGPRPRRYSPSKPAAPIRSTASMWAITPPPRSPTSTATAISTRSSGRRMERCAPSATPGPRPRRYLPSRPAPPIPSTASMWGSTPRPRSPTSMATAISTRWSGRVLEGSAPSRTSAPRPRRCSRRRAGAANR